ncbi:MAG: type II toxin-antitoxin system RelE/ParE family toxin [Porticoccaceae bacterium]|nr:type II toxin-antitoxin system RelE/ParE family toxin [Porticoccaceae bacterium]
MVIWTPRARADLKAIHDHIHKDAPLNAKRVTQKILDKAASLGEFPGIHKRVPEARADDLHEVSVSAWRLIYRAHRHCRAQAATAGRGSAAALGQE